MFKYPHALLEDIRKEWRLSEWMPPESLPKLPKDEILSRVLEVAYHASLLTEESRRLGFRIALLSKQDVTSGEKLSPGTTGARPIVFTKPRDLSVRELLRLAPATDPTKVLICVEPSAAAKDNWQLAIWGLLDTGASWWDYSHGESHGAPMPPNCFTVSSANPGQLTISRRGFILFTLRNGRIATPTQDLFDDGPIAAYLKPAREAFYHQVVTSLGTPKYDPDGEDDDYPHRRYVQYLELALLRIRESHHGGTLLVVPNEFRATDSRLTDRALVKYPCTYNIAWGLLVNALASHRKYYDLYFPLRDGRLALTNDRFRQLGMMNQEMQRIDTDIADSVKFLASLSGVDGAIVITDHFRLIGFGAEVIAISPTLTHVKAVSDNAGMQGELTPIDTYGTRHRSAFRFCSSYEHSVAFVVSQDGGVKAVKRVGSDVLLWPDINVGFFEI